MTEEQLSAIAAVALFDPPSAYPHVSALVAEVRKLRGLLRDLEWDKENLCPICNGDLRSGPPHAPDCALAAALR